MKRILIVDDEPITLKLVEEYFSSRGYDTYTAMDGFIALDKIQKTKIDLIITDLMMPNLSGISLLGLLKTYFLDKTPVIMISSLDKSDVILKSMGLPEENFLIKPLDLSMLLARVEKLLEATN